MILQWNSLFDKPFPPRSVDRQLPLFHWMLMKPRQNKVQWMFEWSIKNKLHRHIIACNQGQQIPFPATRNTVPSGTRKCVAMCNVCTSGWAKMWAKVYATKRAHQKQQRVHEDVCLCVCIFSVQWNWINENAQKRMKKRGNDIKKYEPSLSRVQHAVRVRGGVLRLLLHPVQLLLRKRIINHQYPNHPWLTRR